MNLLTELKKENILLLTTQKSNAESSLIKILSDLQCYGKRLGYVSIQHSIEDVTETFRKNKLRIDKFYFVDAITATRNVPPLKNNCIFVSSPSSLTELRISFTTLFCDKNRELVFFDGATGLSNLFERHQITRFFRDIIIITHSFAGKLILLAYTDDSPELIKDISMFTDKVINF